MREPGLHVTPPVLWADSAARMAHERGTARGVRVIRLHGFLGRSLAACLSAEARGQSDARSVALLSLIT